MFCERRRAAETNASRSNGSASEILRWSEAEDEDFVPENKPMLAAASATYLYTDYACTILKSNWARRWGRSELEAHFSPPSSRLHLPSPSIPSFHSFLATHPYDQARGYRQRLEGDVQGDVRRNVSTRQLLRREPVLNVLLSFLRTFFQNHPMLLETRSLLLLADKVSSTPLPFPPPPPSLR